MRRDLTRIFDEYLVASARMGDRAALQKLARNWQGRLMAHAYRLTGDREMALDITQEAWVHIVKGLPKLQDTATFPAWTYRIVTRRAADSIRRIQRQRRTNAAYAAEPENAERSAQDTEARADSGPLNRAMAGLSEVQRSAVALFYIEEFSIAEIAAVQEVPAGTVKTRLMHARRKLRDALKGESDG